MGSTLAPSAPHARELLAEFKATGSQHAFQEIVRRYAGMVFGVCLRTTKNTHDAEDATQAVFLSLAVQCKTNDGVRFVGPWLQQVAKRVSLDIKRSKKRREAREQRHHSMNGNGNGHTEVEKSGAVDVDQLKGVLGEELNQLPAKYRLPLILHYFGGMTRDEMARELNCKPATLGVRIHRGREMLGRRLHERGAAPPGLMLSSILAISVKSSIHEALVARTIDAVARMGTGNDLAKLISSQVMAYTRRAAMGAAMAAKLKTVAAVVIVMAVTAIAGGAVAKLAPLDLKLPSFFHFNWVPKFWSPLPTPSYSLAKKPAPQTPDRSVQAPAKAAELPAPIETPAVIVQTTRKRTNATTIVKSDGSSAVASSTSAKPSGDKPSAKPQAATLAANGPVTGSAGATKPQSPRATVADSTPTDSTGTSSESNTKSTGNVKVATVDSANTIDPDATDKTKAMTKATYLSVGSGGMGGGGGNGTFALNGGAISFDIEAIGAGGATGTFNQNGGTNTFTQLSIAPDPGGHGTVNLKSGSIRVKSGPDGVAGIVVGGKGDGDLNLGTPNTSATISGTDGAVAPGGSDPSLVVRGDPMGSGKITGAATVDLRGVFVNNGQVIADGFGHQRSLDFDSFKKVVNTIENSPEGGNHGWFARNGGRLSLPGIPISAGTGTYTWGESATDDKIDLVNSARLTLHDVPNSGYLNISLLALDRGGIPPFPAGHHFIGVWQMDIIQLMRDDSTGILSSVSMDPGGIDFTVRYDDALAAQLGLDENVLKLWKFQNGQWSRILDNFVRDPADHILMGHIDGNTEYFAVSAPEPGSFTLLLVGGSAMALKRRRRQ